jgi:N-acetyl-anhydromuramyl-L-alanine amidase AmpD
VTDEAPFLLRSRGPFVLRLPHLTIPAANWQRNAGPQRKRWIVLHSMEAPEKGDTAESVAQWFGGLRGAAPEASAHYCVDNDSIVECLAAELVAWHAPGANQLGIGIEHAGFAKQTREQWLDAYGRAMLALSAKLTAALCQHFQIPVEYVDADDLRHQLTGITTHQQVSVAFGKSTHSDPGPAFPMRDYLDLVRAETDAGTGFET